MTTLEVKPTFANKCPSVNALRTPSIRRPWSVESRQQNRYFASIEWEWLYTTWRGPGRETGYWTWMKYGLGTDFRQRKDFTDDAIFDTRSTLLNTVTGSHRVRYKNTYESISWSHPNDRKKVPQKELGIFSNFRNTTVTLVAYSIFLIKLTISVRFHLTNEQEWSSNGTHLCTAWTMHIYRRMQQQYLFANCFAHPLTHRFSEGLGCLSASIHYSRLHFKKIMSDLTTGGRIETGFRTD